MGIITYFGSAMTALTDGSIHDGSQQRGAARLKTIGAFLHAAAIDL